MTIPEKRSYLAEAQEVLSHWDLGEDVQNWVLSAHLAALRDYYESREYTEEVVQNILGGEAAAKDYEGDLL